MSRPRGGLLTPELLLDGNVVATGPAVANRSAVTLVLDHYDPGSTGVSQSFTYNRLAGQYLAVGLDAGQLSEAYLAAQQADVNTAAIAAKDNAPVLHRRPGRRLPGPGDRDLLP